MPTHQPFGGNSWHSGNMFGSGNPFAYHPYGHQSNPYGHRPDHMSTHVQELQRGLNEQALNTEKQSKVVESLKLNQDDLSKKMEDLRLVLECTRVIGAQEVERRVMMEALLKESTVLQSKFVCQTEERHSQMVDAIQNLQQSITSMAKAAANSTANTSGAPRRAVFNGKKESKDEGTSEDDDDKHDLCQRANHARFYALLLLPPPPTSLQHRRRRRISFSSSSS